MAKIQYKYKAFSVNPGEVSQALNGWGKKGYRLTHLFTYPNSYVVIMEKVKKKKK